MTDVVSYRLSGPIAEITLDDGRANVLSFDALEGLASALDQAAADGVAVLLAGRAGTFSAGFDLSVLTGRPDRAVALVRGGFELAQRLMSFPRPVVAACTGHAIAMGLFLVLASDFRIGAATRDHRLAANEVAIGLTMPRAALAICRHRIAPQHFERVVLLAEAFSPTGSIGAGLLDAVVDADVLVDAARRKARELADLDRSAFAATKLRSRRELLSTLGLAIDQDASEFRQLLAPPVPD